MVLHSTAETGSDLSKAQSGWPKVTKSTEDQHVVLLTERIESKFITDCIKLLQQAKENSFTSPYCIRAPEVSEDKLLFY